MTFTYCNDLSELARLATDLESFGEAHQLTPALVHAFNLCLDEVLTNIISYGYDEPAPHAVSITLSCDNGTVTAVVTDHGKPFNPLEEAPEPDLDADIEDRPIGGLGVFFLKQMMDDVRYERMGHANQLTLSKKG